MAHDLRKARGPDAVKVEFWIFWILRFGFSRGIDVGDIRHVLCRKEQSIRYRHPYPGIWSHALRRRWPDQLYILLEGLFRAHTRPDLED